MLMLKGLCKMNAMFIGQQPFYLVRKLKRQVPKDLPSVNNFGMRNTKSYIKKYTELYREYQLVLPFNFDVLTRVDS